MSDDTDPKYQGVPIQRLPTYGQPHSNKKHYKMSPYAALLNKYGIKEATRLLKLAEDAKKK